MNHSTDFFVKVKPSFLCSLATKTKIIFSEEKTHVIIDLKKAIKLYQQYPTDANIVIAGSHYLGAAISQEFKISFDNI